MKRRRNWRKTILWGLAGLVPGAIVGALFIPWFLNAGLVLFFSIRVPFSKVPYLMMVGAVVGALWMAGYWAFVEGDRRSQIERDWHALKEADRLAAAESNPDA